MISNETRSEVKVGYRDQQLDGPHQNHSSEGSDHLLEVSQTLNKHSEEFKPDVWGSVPLCRSITRRRASATRRRKTYCLSRVVCSRPVFASGTACEQFGHMIRRSLSLHDISCITPLKSFLQDEHTRQLVCHRFSPNLAQASSIVMWQAIHRSEFCAARFSDTPCVSSSDCLVSLAASRLERSSKKTCKASPSLCSRSCE